MLEIITGWKNRGEKKVEYEDRRVQSDKIGWFLASRAFGLSIVYNYLKKLGEVS